MEKNLDRNRLIVVLFTVVLNVAVVGLLSRVSWSDWKTGAGLNLFDNLILIGFAILTKDRLVGKLLLFGLVVGFLELPTDAWIVDVTRTLDYSVGGGPMIWRSPIWMPFAWQVVAVQFGYIGIRLFDQFGPVGILLTGLLGAINIPYYEEMALRIHWWRYHDTLMFPGTHTPWAIIVGEFFIAGYLAVFAGWAKREGIVATVLAGVFAAMAMFGGYALPYWLIAR